LFFAALHTLNRRLIFVLDAASIPGFVLFRVCPIRGACV
jgi:hypothetical protein